MGSKIFTYFLISPHNIFFNYSNGFSCVSSSPYFFMAPRWPPRLDALAKFESHRRCRLPSFHSRVYWMSSTVYHYSLLQSTCICLSKTKHTIIIICRRNRSKLKILLPLGREASVSVFFRLLSRWGGHFNHSPLFVGDVRRTKFLPLQVVLWRRSSLGFFRRYVVIERMCMPPVCNPWWHKLSTHDNSIDMPNNMFPDVLDDIVTFLMRNMYNLCNFKLSTWA